MSSIRFHVRVTPYTGRMNPLTTVLSLPVRDPLRSLSFYRDGLGLETDGVEDGILALELPNLSLFLIETTEYSSYLEPLQSAATGAAGSDAPGDAGLRESAPGAAIISCAFATRAEIDDILARASASGGAVAAPIDEDGSYMGYFSDPDGHVWELVANAHTARAAAEADSSREEGAQPS